jgi:hypothetical protein
MSEFLAQYSTEAEVSAGVVPVALAERLPVPGV